MTSDLFSTIIDEEKIFVCTFVFQLKYNLDNLKKYWQKFKNRTCVLHNINNELL